VIAIETENLEINWEIPANDLGIPGYTASIAAFCLSSHSPVIFRSAPVDMVYRKEYLGCLSAASTFVSIMIQDNPLYPSAIFLGSVGAFVFIPNRSHFGTATIAIPMPAWIQQSTARTYSIADAIEDFPISSISAILAFSPNFAITSTSALFGGWWIFAASPTQPSQPANCVNLCVTHQDNISKGIQRKQVSIYILGAAKEAERVRAERKAARRLC